MTTPHRPSLEELTETLIARHGWLVSGDDLVTLLGYPSAAAFRQAVDRTEMEVRAAARSRHELESARRDAVEQVLLRVGLMRERSDMSRHYGASRRTE